MSQCAFADNNSEVIHRFYLTPIVECGLWHLCGVALKTIEYYYEELAKDEIDQNRFNEELDCFARNNRYGDRENLLRAFSNVVSFTNRTRLENYLQHGLEILNQGTMFEVIQNKKTGKLFKKIKINGYRVDHYEIKVWKKH